MNSLSSGFFLLKQNQKPDFGYTTGSCAAAASCAASRMLIQQKNVPYVFLQTPSGITICLEVLNAVFTKDVAICAVKKDSGSDPDITNGVLVYATVKFCNEPGVFIKGGSGVGRITLPGLNQKVGEWAINSVPRDMIKKSVLNELKNISRGLSITLSIPEGKNLAYKTFNPRLGIVDGISVLGTTGILRPMSLEAIIETIKIETNVRKEQGYTILPVVPGNYGLDFLKKEYNFDFDIAVECSNFAYDSIQIACESGFKKYFFTGHLGKLVKIAGGAKNTHSKFGDNRMAVLCKIAKEFCAKEKYCNLEAELNSCVSTEEAVDVLEEFDLKDCVLKKVAELVKMNMTCWGKDIQVEVLVFTKKHGLLAFTQNAKSFIEELKENVSDLKGERS